MANNFNKEQLKNEIEAVMQFSNQYDMRDVENVKRVRSYIISNIENASPIGKQYYDRLDAIINDTASELCFVCKKVKSHDGIICDSCMSKYSGNKLLFYDQSIELDIALSEFLSDEMDSDNPEKDEQIEINSGESPNPSELKDDFFSESFDELKKKGKGLLSKAIKWEREKRVKWAIQAAYAEEQEKRKPHINKIKHERPLTPTEQQTIALLEAQKNAAFSQMRQYEADLSSYNAANPYGYSDERNRIRNAKSEASLRGAQLCEQIQKIRDSAIWYEEVTIPPEIDPSVPIIVDEEGIRKRIMKM